ncbi:hypothetical protein [Roseisalinus antarcticus]|uniref:Uncharacterized protein n=1 Tax=Roseisalinus antarcticus TaxID=254357 RepID=A0A1Y5SRV0_9RHOB|nr:hypothetical protein [Roseisalinus antarcticus]SLN43727.1 hypothetical protein ROA7023_01794 [Roseisalinus antarcticus]
MDPISLTFYAVVCACLSWAAPVLGGILPRLAIGAVVGMVAATLLPILRGLLSAPY